MKNCGRTKEWVEGVRSSKERRYPGSRWWGEPFISKLGLEWVKGSEQTLQYSTWKKYFVKSIFWMMYIWVKRSIWRIYREIMKILSSLTKYSWKFRENNLVYFNLLKKTAFYFTKFFECPGFCQCQWFSGLPLSMSMMMYSIVKLAIEAP